MNWEQKTLAELCNKLTDGTHDSPKLQPSGMPFIKGVHVKQGIIDFENCDYITYEEHQKVIKRSKPERNDILLANIGINIGELGYVKTDDEFSIKNVALLKVNQEAIDSRYLYYNLKNPSQQERLRNHKGGSAQPFLSLETLRGYKIQFHKSNSTQRKIASILSAYDDLIENNLKRIKLLEEKAQLHYMQYKPVEKIELQDIADYLGRGVTPKYEEGSGFYAINQKANKGSLLEYSQFKSLDTKLEVPEDKFAKWGDLLINSLGEGTLGRVHFYSDKSDLFAVDQHLSIFRTKKQHYTFYLYQFLSSNYGQGLLDSLKKGGTNMTMLNISDLRQLIASFPSEKELIELWNICKPLFQLKQTLISQNTKLREARDILLPKLMNGQIEV